MASPNNTGGPRHEDPDVRPIPTQPTEDSRRYNRTWTFVQIDTDEGITGNGEATNYPGGGSLVVASAINSELRKIATMAEAYYIPVSPHNAMGSVQIIAGAHTMMTVPNFYRLEISIAALEGYNAVLDKHLDIRDGNLHLPSGPGLGYGLDTEFMAARPDPAWNG
jgi:L-alanine-DL-glutamate epimerase-like enolase superfamily enzyme